MVPKGPKTMSQAGSKQEGFTILEIVLVVLLMALAMGISYPSLTRSHSVFQIRATGRNVLNTLRYAREKAITEQQVLIVSVDRESQTVVLSDEFGGDAKTIAMPNNIRIARIALQGQEVTQGVLKIRFLPNGGSDNAEILLNSDRASALRIVTDPITGGARIVTGQGDNAQ
jgi:Tfp pilus assembly protein FimT